MVNKKLWTLEHRAGEEREVGQSWTGGLAQGCAPVFQPFGEPGGRNPTSLLPLSFQFAAWNLKG